MPSRPSVSVFGSWERDVMIGTPVFDPGTDMLWGRAPRRVRRRCDLARSQVGVDALTPVVCGTRVRNTWSHNALVTP